MSASIICSIIKDEKAAGRLEALGPWPSIEMAKDIDRLLTSYIVHK